MKLIIQIPCLNEEETLPQTLVDLPRSIPGIDKVEILVIDDGSTDRTVEVARRFGVHHIVENGTNRGLARSFSRGIEEALRQGADIIVNTDGDNQYCGADIAKLVAPIVARQADVVIGDRQTRKIAHFSPFKKLLQRLGSTAVSTLAGTRVPDAVSGFRAISREAALKTNIVSPFSYTIETVLQAGRKNMKIVSVPVGTNAKTRESRLFTNIPNFVTRQLKTLLQMYVMYSPLRAFCTLGLVLAAVGIAPILRFMWFYFSGDGTGHLQSLVLGGVLCVMAFIAFTAGLLADVVSRNRQLLELTLEKVRRLELAQGESVPASTEEPDTTVIEPASLRAQG
ncbi:glycosyltransferase family 2 protein [Citromicrobium bathyomarinum]|uniref:glycosyltransferase family 2 protein n=1 Tax=Citromicrobium bathyomarinum TaxID=72174 RepID=UPI00315B3126